MISSSNSGRAFPPTHSSILDGALLLFLGNFGGLIRRLAALFFASFQISLSFSSHLIFFRISTGFFSRFSELSQYWNLRNDVLKLSLCLRRRIASLNTKKYSNICIWDRTPWIRAFASLCLYLSKQQSPVLLALYNFHKYLSMSLLQLYSEFRQIILALKIYLWNDLHFGNTLLCRFFEDEREKFRRKLLYDVSGAFETTVEFLIQSQHAKLLEWQWHNNVWGKQGTEWTSFSTPSLSRKVFWCFQEVEKRCIGN